MAVLLITHDLGVVAEIADRRRASCMPGAIVETRRRSPTLFARAAPSLHARACSRRSRARANAPSEPLPMIPGTVPAPGRAAAGLPLRASAARARIERCRGRAAARRARRDAPAGPPRAPAGIPCRARGGLTRRRCSRSAGSQDASPAAAARGAVRAPVDGVDLDAGARRDARPRRRESGCGKSTLGARAAAADRADRGRDPLRRRATCARSATRRCARMPARHADRLPGPVRVAQSAHDGRRHRSPSRLAIHGIGDARRARRRVARAARAGRPRRRGRARATRTSSPAASASASASRARSRSSRSSSSPTSRSRRSTSRSRRRS